MGGGSSARHGRAHRPAREPALSELDLRILGLLSAHRVLTQTQLAAISAGVPARTLRYRCNRLAKHGLLGRTRPYRERGSAPHHLWPTRRGEAMACGGHRPGEDAITLEEGGELDRVEREALTALGPMFVDLLLPQLSEREPSATERHASEALAHHHRDEQLERIDDIVGRFGEMPSLRKARQRIKEGKLLKGHNVRQLGNENWTDEKTGLAEPN
jgi:hypothetical protein